MAGTKKNLKNFYGFKATTFGEEYNAAASGFFEIKVADFVINRVTEKMESKYLDADRELDNITTETYTHGKVTFTKPLTASAYNELAELTKAGLGQIVQAYNAPGGIVQSLTANTVTLDDAADLAEGDYICFGVPGSNYYSSINKITNIATTVITLKYDLTAEEQIMIETGVDQVIQVPVINPAKVVDSNFIFVCEYSDNSVEVLRGAKVAISYDSARKGKQELKFEIKAASIASEDASGTDYVKPSGTIAYEGNHESIYLNFAQKWVYDTVTAAAKAVCPYGFDLKIAHTLKAEEAVCGINGIIDYYNMASLTAELEVAKTVANKKTFAGRNGVNSNNFLYLAQGNLAFIADVIRFTNADFGYTDEFDHVKMNADINFDKETVFLLALPH